MVENSPRRTWRAMRSGIASSLETGRAQVARWSGRRATRSSTTIPAAASSGRPYLLILRRVSPKVRLRTTQERGFDLPWGPSYPRRMIPRRLLIVFIPLVVVASPACSRVRSAPPAPASESGPETVVARVEGRPITQKEVDAKAGGTLQRLADEEYQARRDALDDLITEKLVDTQASAQKISRDELL